MRSGCFERVVKHAKKFAKVLLEQIKSRVLDAAQRDEFRIFNTVNIFPHLSASTEYEQLTFDRIAHRMRTLPNFDARRACQDWPCFVNFVRIRLKHSVQYAEYMQHQSDVGAVAPRDDDFWNPILYELSKADAFSDVCTLIKLNLIARRKLQPQCERLFSYVKLVQGLYSTAVSLCSQ